MVVPPAGDISPGNCEEMAAVLSSNQGVTNGPSLEGEAIHSLCLSLQYFFLAGKHQRRVFDPTCVSLRDPLPEKSAARLHTHTPCPPCLD